MKVLREAMLTTLDNPLSPFDDYKAWYTRDQSQGHDCSGFVARILVSSNELSRADKAQYVEDAIDEIVSYDVTGNYIKVMRDVEYED
jgi:hypothetical protein